ncbi:MAG: UDP-glucose 6-dehydrogenase, partial [Acidimicrobiales bacterium]
MNNELSRESIAIVGSGYLGTVVAACFASVGHRVVGVESDPRKLAQLGAGHAPFPEPGLDDLLASTLDSGKLTFTADLAAATRECEIVFLCVGTPAGPDGQVDLSALATAGRVIGENSHPGLIIVTKSTVPVGTGRWLQSLIEDQIAINGRAPTFSIVSNPEFLREGSAVQDFFHPDRIVVGGDDGQACQRVIDMHQPIICPDGP